jgi:hypothetical protein
VDKDMSFFKETAMSVVRHGLAFFSASPDLCQPIWRGLKTALLDFFAPLLISQQTFVYF